jgi:hypothetical protein
MRNGSPRQYPRIVELDLDADEQNNEADSDTEYTNYRQQHYPHAFFYNNSHVRQPVFTMPNNASTAYYHQQQQQGFPNAFMYAHHHHHAHPHMPQQQFYQPHQHAYPQFAHQYHPMMAAQGILIEVIDEEEPTNPAGNGVNPSTNETTAPSANVDSQETLYLVTMNGQRYVMNKDQIMQFATEMYQQQIYHNHQQQHFQQQQYFQQQQLFRQQQQQQQQQPPSQDTVYYTL